MLFFLLKTLQKKEEGGEEREDRKMGGQKGERKIRGGK